MNDKYLSRVQQEAIDLLIGELQQMLDRCLDFSTEGAEEIVSLSSQLTQLEHLAATADIIGLSALQALWQWLEKNIQHWMSSKAPLSSEQQVLLDIWPAYFLDYLQRLRQGALTRESIQPPASYVMSEAWVLSIDQPMWQQLEAVLIQPDFIDDIAISSPLPAIASLDMLSLALPDDLHTDLFEGLLIELPGQVNHFSEAIQHYIKHSELKSLLAAQRIAHTIKGSANIVGVAGLANFMHFSEDLLEAISHGHHAPDDQLSLLLMDMVDTLAGLFEGLVSGHQPDEEAVRVMQAILDCCHAYRKNNVERPLKFVGHNVKNSNRSSFDDIDAPAENSVISESDLVNDEVLSQALNVGASGEKLSNNIASQLRIREETAQDLLRLAGSHAITTNRLQSQLQDVKQQLQQVTQLNKKLALLTEEFGQLIDSENGPLPPLKKCIAADIPEIEHYHELHSFFHQLQEIVADTKEATQTAKGQLRVLDEQAWRQQITQRESENLLLGMRMVPVRNLESRFQRCVRQACRLTGKQAQLVIAGSDTLIDSRVLYDIIDPIMHLLRNAVSHGVEAAADRLAAGKPPQGVITLQFTNLGKTIAIDVIDDGAGLDYVAIKTRAEALGMTLPVTDVTSDEGRRWLNQVIFVPGFSTQSRVDHIAGRGIGLDAVSQAIISLKGRVTADSLPAERTHFSIRLPVTVISEHGLVVRQGQQQWVVSSRSIEQLLFPEQSQFEQVDGEWRYHFNNQSLNVYPLAALAQTLNNHSLPLEKHRALLVVEIWPGERAAVLVEHVLASKDMVFTPLTPWTPSVTGVIGATILGDGHVAAVLDVQHLLLEALSHNIKVGEWFSAANTKNARIFEKPVALVVDDSLSARRSLAQFVSDFGMDVCTAKDGFEAVDIMQEKIPDIVLLDLEMPRMNGLELTTHIRANASTRHVPVVMITSRTTENHRHLAEVAGVDSYLNKPFSEDELLKYLQSSIRH